MVVWEETCFGRKSRVCWGMNSILLRWNPWDFLLLAHLLLIMGAGIPAYAEDILRNVPIRTCHFSLGQPVFCQQPYSGQAVIKQSGVFRVCKISLGAVSFCQAPYTGRSLTKMQSGLYEQCDMTLGQIRFCYGPYTGKAVLQPELQ